MDANNRALVEALMRRQMPNLFGGVETSTEPPRQRAFAARMYDRVAPVPKSIMNGFTDAATLPGDVMGGGYSLPPMDAPGISEDDAYNVYQDGQLVGNRLANQQGLIDRSIGLATGFTGSGAGATAAQGRRTALDPNVVRMGGGASGKTPRNQIKVGDRVFLSASDGSLDMGRLGEEVAKASGGRFKDKPIRLEIGEPGKEGYGALHLGPQRTERAQRLGYVDEVDMIEDISRNFDIVVEQANRRLMLVKKNGANRYAIVELREGDDAYYGITTTFIEGRKNVGKEKHTSLYREINKRGGKLIWERE